MFSVISFLLSSAPIFLWFLWLKSVSWWIALPITFMILARCFWMDADFQTWISPHFFQPARDYKGKVFWVTGASSGIGQEFARQLVKLGAKVIISSRRRGKLEEIQKRFGSDNCAVLPLDMEKVAMLPEVVEAAIAIFGRIDGIVNNAGVGQRSRLLDASWECIQSITHVNYTGHIALTKAVLPQLLAPGKLIINISSVQGKLGLAKRTAYSGAKHALLGFFDALRAETKKSGLRITNVCPGYVSTPFAVNALNPSGGPQGKKEHRTCVSVERLVHLSLAAASAGVREAWIARGKSMVAMTLNQYLPGLTRIVIERLGS